MHRRKVALRMARMIIGERYSKLVFTESSDNRMLGQERSYVSRNPPDAAGYFKIA